MRALCFFSCIAILVSSGCFAPKSINNEANTCHLITRQYTLVFSAKDGADAIVNSVSSCKEPACILYAPVISALVVPAGSFVVSGSIVVVGNTIHWLERQGKCDDSELKKAVEQIISTTVKLGGVVIKTKEDAISWLKSLGSAKQL